MLLHVDYSVYWVLNTPVAIITSDTVYGRHSVGEMLTKYYHLGNEPDSISSAIFVWQFFKERYLTDEELKTVLDDNGLKSSDLK